MAATTRTRRTPPGAVPGVEAAAPLRTTYQVLELPHGKAAVAAVASDPDSGRTPAQLHDASLRLATDLYGSPVRLMVGVAFVAGALVVALVAYTQVTEQQRQLGVLKALGATPRRLRRIAVGETAFLTALGAPAASCCCWPTSRRRTSMPHEAGTWRGCCAHWPTTTAAPSSSSATTTGCARSPTVCCGSRTAHSGSSPRW